MVVDMLEKCKERKKEIESTFYEMVETSNDIPALERIADEMTALEILIIRMEKQKFENEQMRECISHYKN